MSSQRPPVTGFHLLLIGAGASTLYTLINLVKRLRALPRPRTPFRIAIVERSPDAARVDWSRAPLPCLYGDPAMVADILEILLSNAVKFSARSATPQIGIAACEIDGNPGIEVRDNGVGFEMRYADKLFGMFQRLHQSEGFEGSGMNLAVCKRLVERLGGSVAAEGRVGHGATFRFTLGAAVPGTAQPSAPAAQVRVAAT